MRLIELDPRFIRPTTNGWQSVDSLAEALGIEFLCPKCYAENGNSAKGTHIVICWSPAVPPDEGFIGPGRWELVGSGFDNLSLVAGSSSVRLEGGCDAHFFIQNGEVRNA